MKERCAPSKPFFRRTLSCCCTLSIFMAVILVSPAHEQAQAKEKKIRYRKSQNVDFDGSSVDGVARSPDGAYLAEKRGVKFLPLYEVKKQFDENIKNSVRHLR